MAHLYDRLPRKSEMAYGQGLRARRPKLFGGWPALALLIATDRLRGTDPKKPGKIPARTNRPSLSQIKRIQVQHGARL